MNRTAYVILLCIFTLLTACAGSGSASRTGGARAAYGNSVPFRENARSNAKAKKKAKRNADRKKLKNDRETYRRGLPI